MKTFALISDIHGNIRKFERALAQTKASFVIQLGDLGHEEIWNWLPEDGMYEETKLYVVPGNHDSYPEATEYVNSLHGYGFVPDTKIFYLSGAKTNELRNSTKGINWWEEEELDQSVLDEAVEFVRNNEIETIVTHTPPGFWFRQYYQQNNKSRTEECLDRILGLLLERNFYVDWYSGHVHFHSFHQHDCVAFTTMKTGSTRHVVRKDLKDFNGPRSQEDILFGYVQYWVKNEKWPEGFYNYNIAIDIGEKRYKQLRDYEGLLKVYNFKQKQKEMVFT